MNIVKKMAIAAALLCAAAVANAEDGGMKIGARVGYSFQMVGSNDMGMLGVQAGVAASIPAGPIAIAPEVAFVYRNNYSNLLIESQTEMAISVPVIVKYAFGGMFAGTGVQVDLPLGAEQCSKYPLSGEDKCISMDGKEIEVAGVKTGAHNPERATIDLGIPFVFGYNIMPNLAVDLRYVWGLLAHSKYKMSLLGITTEIETDPLSSLSVNFTYFF